MKNRFMLKDWHAHASMGIRKLRLNIGVLA
jgi:hypothetical protein